MNHTNPPQIEIKLLEFIGTALSCQWDLGEFDWINHNITENQIKMRLIDMISAKMIELKLVEFTKSEDILTGVVSFRARAFVLPDNQVKTLRLEKLI
jgi:hypothetical protein